MFALFFFFLILIPLDPSVFFFLQKRKSYSLIVCCRLFAIPLPSYRASVSTRLCNKQMSLCVSSNWAAFHQATRQSFKRETPFDRAIVRARSAIFVILLVSVVVDWKSTMLSANHQIVSTCRSDGFCLDLDLFFFSLNSIKGEKIWLTYCKIVCLFVHK